MSYAEEFEKLYNEKSVEYFKNYIEGKCIHDVLYNMSKSTVLNLARSLTQTNIFIDCLCTIRDDKKFFNNLDLETQKLLKNTITSFKIICKDLNKILEPIGQGLLD